MEERKTEKKRKRNMRKEERKKIWKQAEERKRESKTRMKNGKWTEKKWREGAEQKHPKKKKRNQGRETSKKQQRKRKNNNKMTIHEKGNSSSASIKFRPGDYVFVSETIPALLWIRWRQQPRNQRCRHIKGAWSGVGWKTLRVRTCPRIFFFFGIADLVFSLHTLFILPEVKLISPFCQNRKGLSVHSVGRITYFPRKTSFSIGSVW